MSRRSIPYGRQLIDDEDIAAVVDVLRGDWLTTGPAVERFERAFSAYVGAEHGVAVTSGTAALHLAALAAGIGPGDEVIVPAMTFAASANCVRYVGGDVVFADVRDDTLTIDPVHAESLITSRTKALVVVDYAGTPCDMGPLMDLAERHGLMVIEDACHAPGAEYLGQRVGGIAHMTVFSFHPVKHLTTGEGGMVTTNDEALAARVRSLRNHGINSDFRARAEAGTWRYDVAELGFNYRLSDLNCALGASQLRKLDDWLAVRRELAATYDQALAEIPSVRVPTVPDDRLGAWHLYPIRFNGDDREALRQRAFEHLRANGIGANVHYLPVYLNTYYRELGYPAGLCPVAEDAYASLLSLPMWAGMTDDDLHYVVDCLRTIPGDVAAG